MQTQTRCATQTFIFEEFLLTLLQVWSSYSVLNVLYSLIQKSKINEHLVALQEGKSAEEIA